jgi:hypothetical protein
MPAGGASGIANRPGAGGAGTQFRPGGIDRPGGIANRPGAGGPGTQRRPGDRPGGIANRGVRPGQGGAGERWQRPANLPARGDRTAWNNFRNDRVTNVRNVTQNNVNFNRAVARPGGWWGRPGGTGAWAHGYAHGWAGSNRWHNWNGFWGYNGYRPNYWWGAATVAGLTGLTVGSLFSSDTQPVYYNYGDNVYYDNNQVYMDGQSVGPADQYAAQAIEIASVPVPDPPPMPEVPDTSSAAPPQPTEQEQAAMDEYAKNWMPLGVFAVTKDNDPGEPAYFLQLAVHKDGYIAGTLFNSIKNETSPVEGSVDKKSQRAAWHLGDDKELVMETGLYNLTQDSAPALLHFGTEKTEPRLLVRMNEPPDQSASDSTTIVR